MIRYGKIRPRKLQKSDAIYLFAPATAVKEPYKGQGKSLLVEAGYEVICGQSLDELPFPFAAGSPQIRLGDWQAALSLNVAAILPARGGYGCIELLPDAPFQDTADLAPLWIGCSDCTYLQAVLLQKYGLTTFYGPMPCGQLADQSEPGRDAYLATLRGTVPDHYVFDTSIRLTSGSCEGEVRGGCLSILASMCGTPWQVDGQDALLILEDVGEHPFRIERMLYQLLHSGVFAGCRGVIFGSFPGCVDQANDATLIVKVLRQFAENLGIPAIFGAPIGHGCGTIPFPTGIPAKMQENQVTVLESPFL